MLNQSLELKLKQEQKLTQKLIQKLELIPMTNLELDNLIENELMINEFLEASREKNENDSGNDENSPDSTVSDELDMDREVLYSQNDWEDIRKRSSLKKDSSGDRNSFLENIPEKDENSFKRHISNEIILKLGDGEEKKIALFMIELLDFKGFLPYTSEQVTKLSLKKGEDPENKIDIVRKVRDIMMRIEPYGICSHDVREYLLIQLEMRNLSNPVLRHIVNDYLEELSRNRLQFIATRISCTVEEVQEALSELRDNIPPYPSFGFSVENVEYIKPDATIYEDGTIIIHSKYRKLWTVDEEKYKEKIRNLKDVETRKFLRKQFEKARELVNNFYSRSSLFEELLQIIYREQERFFHGQTLNPLKQIDVAQELGVNVSTVSRIVNGKYVRIPSGIMHVADFFVNVSTGDISSDEAMSRIREIISREDRKNPLSDEEIMILLKKEHNIDIKRRTVAKYRERLGILSSRQRKEFL